MHAVIGTFDLGAVGVRAVLSMCPPSSEQQPMALPSLEGAEPAFADHPAIVCEAGPSLLLVSVNVAVPARAAASVARELVRELAARGVTRVEVLSGARIAALSVSPLNGHPAASWGLPAVPPSCACPDALLSALFHFLGVSGVPSALVVAPSYRYPDEGGLRALASASSLPYAVDAGAAAAVAGPAPSPQKGAQFYI